MADTSEEDILAPLRLMEKLNDGPLHYYIALAETDDPVLRAAAWRTLIDAVSVPERLHGKLIADCRYGAVRKRAFDHFEIIFEHGLADEAMNTPLSGEDGAAELMRGLAERDYARARDGCILMFLADGQPQHLAAATDHAEGAGGWRSAAATAAQALAAFPQHPIFCANLIRRFEDAGQAALAEALANRLAAAGKFPHLAELARVEATALAGSSKQALDMLERLERAPALQKALTPFSGLMRKVQADALHKLGETRKAHASYVEMHKLDRQGAAQIDAGEYLRVLDVRNRLEIPPMPPSPRHDVVQMLGFPRSGTTLLENALMSHPAIETFEEVPTLRASVTHIERVLQQKRPWAGSKTDLYVMGRDKYYEEIDRLRRKAGATLLVDKLPIRTGDATFIAKLFPEWRYIFSIRHPYDVVLSCFRQRFAPNPAMENFRTIEGGARLYDYVMTQWFGVHGLDNPAVHYVRYDELATDFRPVMERTLGFLGLPWDETVMDFAAKAEQRASRTPSYQKVRQGLSVGVQTYWRKYDFLWQTPEARPLQKWAEFFGYPTK